MWNAVIIEVRHEEQISSTPIRQGLDAHNRDA
jgi:hypothetical protein